ncbi:transporter substrate-binding domain-containing protein [Pseudomonas sp. H2_E05]
MTQRQNGWLFSRQYPGSLRQGRAGQSRDKNPVLSEPGSGVLRPGSGAAGCIPSGCASSPTGFYQLPQGADYEMSPSVESPYLPSKTAIGIAKGNTELKALLDKAIQALHDDGTYDSIQKQHFGDLNLYSGK